MAKNPPEQVHPNWHNLPAFQRMQYEFAAWIRTPDPTHTPQNIERRRMNVYRDLFFGNMCAFVENTFPVAKEVVGQQTWQPLMQQFFAEHLAKSPYFRDIPVEFMTWLQHHPEKLEHLPPWLPELLHYEWLELDIGARDRSFVDGTEKKYDDCLPSESWPGGGWPGGFGERPPQSGERPLLSPFFEIAAYQFPVHQISADYQPETPPETPTFLVVYRRRDNRVRFMELTPQVALYLQALSENQDATPQDALHVVEQQTGSSLGEAWLSQTLSDLYEREIVSGDFHQQT